MSTKWEAKDRKKHEAGKLVKSRNEPCCIVQVRARMRQRRVQSRRLEGHIGWAVAGRGLECH